MIKFYEQNVINKIIIKDEVNPHLLFFKPHNLFKNRCYPFEECGFHKSKLIQLILNVLEQDGKASNN